MQPSLYVRDEEVFGRATLRIRRGSRADGEKQLPVFFAVLGVELRCEERFADCFVGARGSFTLYLIGI